jgi:hypothetical protein
VTQPGSAAFLGVRHLAVTWNEETVFCGYGFETVREALGQGKAVALLIPGFALYHGLDPQQLLGMLPCRPIAIHHAFLSRLLRHTVPDCRMIVGVMVGDNVGTSFSTFREPVIREPLGTQASSRL